jgi:hypothetical protein
MFTKSSYRNNKYDDNKMDHDTFLVISLAIVNFATCIFIISILLFINHFYY